MDTAVLVNQLSDLLGLFDDYVGSDKELVRFSTAQKSDLLAAMGYSIGQVELSAACQNIQTEKFAVGLPEVCVLRPHLADVCRFISPAGQGPESLIWTIQLENNEELEGDSQVERELSVPQLPDHLQACTFKLPSDIPLGYHQLSVTWQGNLYSCPLIQTPAANFQSTDIAAGKRLWGSSIQLYTLRSERNWGIGDFTDLKELVSLQAGLGAGFIGLNPLHALFQQLPEQASPYSPSNRSMINVLYIDPEIVPEFLESTTLQQWLAEPETQTQLRELRASELVDYAGVSDMKHQAFKYLYSVFRQHVQNGTSRADAFNHFVASAGKPLRNHCLYEALMAYFSENGSEPKGWSHWPEGYQHPESELIKKFASSHANQVEFYMYLQFIADEQLNQAHHLALELGMGLGIYRDLAVGSDPDGSEVWSAPEDYCLSVSIGAPPDPLGPNGQDWGLPPLNPRTLQRSGYQPFINLIQNNMRACAALRIDHAMALFRLWWSPRGQSAAQGVYMSYPMEDLLGILLLESHRNQCLIIAEDLGTVPEEVRLAFPKAKLFTNQVFYFEFSASGCNPPDQYSAKALAIVANHDMPTVKAYWQGSDLTLRKELGLFDTESDYLMELANRKNAKKLIMSALNAAKLSSETVKKDMDLALSFAIHEYLATGRSQLVAVQLEDMLLIESPVNIPGTSTEYPNWKRKLTSNTSEIFSNREITEFCQRLNVARGNHTAVD